MTPEQFKDSMAYLGVAYGKEFTQQELIIHYDFLKEYNDATLVKAIKNIIKKSKFLPKINELVEECENCKEQVKYDVLEFMRSKGYFGALSEYEKATRWLETNNIPSWFKEDLNEHYKMMQQVKLEYKETLMLGGS